MKAIGCVCHIVLLCGLSCEYDGNKMVCFKFQPVLNPLRWFRVGGNEKKGGDSWMFGAGAVFGYGPYDCI